MLKSHFWYSKGQRIGVLVLVIFILVLQGIYLFFNFSSDGNKEDNSKEIIAFQRQIDSLKIVELENRKPKIYPFNPNYITDFKGYQLGMSVKEIDRLHNFRKQNKWINSVADFKQVTKISDSLLNVISPYFKFPDWVVKRNQQKKKSNLPLEPYKKESYSTKQPSTFDINQATAEDFRTISGIGEKRSQRIINYRKRLQGFSFNSQLYEVWNIDKEIIERVLKKFKVVKQPVIQRVNINTASFKEVLKNPYIDYKLCKKIFDYRDEVAEFQDISELKNINNFPFDKYDRIILYLEAK